jgi:hypothetical protein
MSYLGGFSPPIFLKSAMAASLHVPIKIVSADGNHNSDCSDSDASSDTGTLLLSECERSDTDENVLSEALKTRRFITNSFLQIIHRPESKEGEFPWLPKDYRNSLKRHSISPWMKNFRIEGIVLKARSPRDYEYRSEMVSLTTDELAFSFFERFLKWRYFKSEKRRTIPSDKVV